MGCRNGYNARTAQWLTFHFGFIRTPLRRHWLFTRPLFRCGIESRRGFPGRIGTLSISYCPQSWHIAGISPWDSTVSDETLPILCRLSRFDNANRDHCDCPRTTATWLLVRTNTATVTDNMVFTLGLRRLRHTLALYSSRDHLVNFVVIRHLSVPLGTGVVETFRWADEPLYVL